MSDLPPKELPKLRTMQSDAEILRSEQNLSSLDIVAKAYTETRQPNLEASLPSIYGWKTYIIAATAVIVLSIAGYAVFKIWDTPNQPPTLVPLKPTANFLPVDKEQIISVKEINPGALIKILQEELAKSLSFGSVAYFPLEYETSTGNKKFADFKDFSRLVSWQPPATFLDFSTGEFNIVVTYTQNGGSLAVIEKTSNYEKTYSSLLEWEKYIWKDWKVFLSSKDIENVDNFIFKDEIVQNHDARVFQDQSGHAILAYAIFDKRFAVVANSREALDIILMRLIKLPPR